MCDVIMPLVQESDAVCLGDLCEEMRCDVLDGTARPSFWDVKLCLEEDMQDLQQDCLVGVINLL